MGHHTCPVCRREWQCKGSDPIAAETCGPVSSCCKDCIGTPAEEAMMVVANHRAKVLGMSSLYQLPTRIPR